MCIRDRCITLACEESIDPEQAGLWIIGRFRSTDEPLSAHVGTNEKTKMAAVLASRSPEAEVEQRRVAADPELEALVQGEESAMREMLEQHAASADEPPLKQQKLEDSAPSAVVSKMELPALGEEFKSRLRSSEYVKNMVQDARLQAVISKIDSAPDCRVALDEMRSNNSDFAEFVSRMVTEVQEGPTPQNEDS
eukprot:TRINITY_DN50597_c0_g1_i1.p1 TRINITY_DN50597_c0_g1~~TRINITY_DN50597_c0_g1_i1.p1  ORF type:complete len:194 (-),score=54.78 TRINITY_DN50597_c0_g1_i1:78-659(-)